MICETKRLHQNHDFRQKNEIHGFRGRPERQQRIFLDKIRHMKKSWLYLLLALLVSGKISAQAETFDIYQYTAPKEWVKQAGSGTMAFTLSDEKKNTFAMIVLYSSRKSEGSAQKDFDKSWDIVSKSTGITTAPQMQAPETDKGWTSLTGVTTYVADKATAAIVLSSFTGSGKCGTVLVSFNDAGYQAAIEAFLNSLDLNANAAPVATQNNNTTTTTATSSSTAGGISYTVPRGWTETKNANGSVSIASPLLECRENSYYTIHYLGSSVYNGNLQEYAANLHKSYFYEGVNAPTQYMSGDKNISKGYDNDGREYLSFATSAHLFDKDRCYHYGMVYLLRTGDQMAVFLVELRPVNSNKEGIPGWGNFLSDCNALRSAWTRFLSAVKFNKPGKPLGTLPEELFGNWESRVILGATYFGFIDSRIMERYHFMEDGRYQSQKMLAGNNYGKYQVTGNKLTITDASGKSSSYRFRLESVFEYGSWKRELTLLDANGKEVTLRYDGE